MRLTIVKIIKRTIKTVLLLPVALSLVLLTMCTNDYVLNPVVTIDDTIDESVTELPDEFYTPIDINDERLIKVYETWLDRIDFVDDGIENGIPFGKLKFSEAVVRTIDKIDIVFVPMKSSAYTMVAEVPSTESSVKLYIQKSKLDDNFMVDANKEPEFWTINNELNFSDEKNRGFSLYARSEGEGWEIPGVTVTAPYYTGSTQPPCCGSTSGHAGGIAGSSGGYSNIPSNGSSSSATGSVFIYSASNAQSRQKLCGNYTFKKIGGRWVANILQIYNLPLENLAVDTNLGV